MKRTFLKILYITILLLLLLWFIDRIILNKEFSDGFWPNFASTVLGLIIGLPLAIWTNTFIQSIQKKAIKKDEDARLKDALILICEKLETNRKRIQFYLSDLNNGKDLYNIDLELSVWEVVKPDIIKNLSDIKLKNSIAYHFSSLSILYKLHEDYKGLKFGINATLDNSHFTRESLKAYLNHFGKSLITESEDIINKLQKNKVVLS